MEDRMNFRFKNLKTKEQIDNICKSKNISFNQLVNEILDDFVVKTDDKKYLKTTNESLIELEKRQNELIKLVQKSLLIEHKILELMTKIYEENDFNEGKISDEFNEFKRNFKVKVIKIGPNKDDFKENFTY